MPAKKKGWATVSYDDKTWTHVLRSNLSKSVLVATYNETRQKTRDL